MAENKQSTLILDEIFSSTTTEASTTETKDATMILDEIFAPTEPINTKDDNGLVQFAGTKKEHSTTEDAPAVVEETSVDLADVQRTLAKDKQIAAATAPVTPQVPTSGFAMPKVDLTKANTDKPTEEGLAASSPLVKKQIGSLLAPKQESIIETTYDDFVGALPTEGIPGRANKLIDKETIRSYFKKGEDGAYHLPNGKTIHSDALLDQFVDNYYIERNHPIFMEKDENYRRNFFKRTFNQTEEQFIADRTAAMDAQLDRLEEAYKKVKADNLDINEMKRQAKIDVAREYQPYTQEDAVWRVLKDVRKSINSARKNSFGSGFREGFSFEDLASYGLAGLGSSVYQLQALNKFVNGEELTPEENLFVEANKLSQQVNEFRGAYSNGSANRIGNIVAFMPSFALQMGATSALPKVGAKALKEITTEVVSDALKQSTLAGLKTASKKASLSMLNDALATPLMTATYQSFADRRGAQYHWEGEELVKEKTPWATDMVKALGETFVERHSEQVGDWITDGLLYSGRRLAQTKVMDNIFGRGLKAVLDYKMPPVLQQMRENMRISGYVGEVGSEIYNNIINPIFTGETESWQELTRGSYYWELLASTAIASGSFYALNVPSFVQQARAIKRTDNARKQLLQSITDDSLRGLLHTINVSDNLQEDLSKFSAFDWKNVPVEDAQRASKYIFDTIQSKMLNAEIIEADRLDAFMPIVQNVTSSLYSGGNISSPTMGTKLALAEMTDGSKVSILVGDVENPETVQVVVKTENHERKVVDVEDIKSVKYVDMSDFLAEQYALMFSKSVDKERLSNFMDTLRAASEDNQGKDVIGALYAKSGYVLYPEGSEVTLTDGTTGIVVGYDNGSYLVADPNMPEMVTRVGFLNILQPKEEDAVAQKEFILEFEESGENVDESTYVSEEEILSQKLAAAAANLSTDEGSDIYIIRLADGREATVKQGNIAQFEDGRVDAELSDATVVVKFADSAEPEQISIDEVESIVEKLATEEVIAMAKSNIEEQLAKKNLITSSVEAYGVADVVLTEGVAGQITAVLENGQYAFTWVGEDNQPHTIPVMLDHIAEVVSPAPETATTEVEATEETAEVEYVEPEEVKERFEGFNPEPINVDNVDWGKLSKDDYLNISVMAYGPAETLAKSRTFYLNTKGKLPAAVKKVEAQDLVIENIRKQFASLANPTEEMKLRKKLSDAEAEKARRQKLVDAIQKDLDKFAYAMKQLGVDITEELQIAEQREALEREKASLVEADAMLDAQHAEDSQTIMNTIVNNEGTRKRIYDMYVAKGTAPEEASITSAVLWDIVSGNIKLRWEDHKTDSGSVEKGLGSELGLTKSAADKRAYKAVLAKDGESVDSYVHSLWERLDGYSNDLNDLEIKDEVLSVLQSNPNGSVALKSLYDALGVEADMEESFAMSKGDIQQQIADVDKRLAENAIAQRAFDKKVQDKVDILEGKNVPGENSVEKNAASSERSSVDSPNSSSGSLSLNPNGRLRVESFGNSKHTAKVNEIINNTKEIKRKIQNFFNEEGFRGVDTAVDAIRAIGKKLGLKKSQSSLSYYRELYEGNYLVNENTLYLRVSTHPATDTRMGNEPAGHKVSIVIRKNGEHRDTGEHNGYEEIVYEPSEITPTEAANAIIKGIQSLLETGKYVDTTGKARTTIYPPTSIPTNQATEGESISSLIRNTPPKGVSQEKWNAVVGHLKETLGTDSVITDVNKMREVLDYLLDEEGYQNGNAAFSMRTYAEEGRQKLVDYVNDRVAKNLLTKAEADDIILQMDDIYNICQEYKDKYAPFGEWSDAAVVRDEEGKPVFSVIKKNGEYAMNLDFSLVCKKRRTLDAVFRKMIDRGIISNYELGQVDVAKINDIIRRFGFETACRLCFVDAKRFRVAQVADVFCEMYNPLTDLNDEQLRAVIAEEGNTTRAKIAKMLIEHPENRVKLSRANFMESKGFENMTVNKEVIMKLYNMKKGTGGPKASYGDTQYVNDILGKQWTPEDAYEVGGVRLQSFSDYVPRMVFDYIQMVADLAAKGLPVHAYTKEVLFAQTFGLTGIKINLSLVPKVVEGGIAPGLDAEGNYVWQEGETFPYEEAIALQNAEGYKENCGTIAVGVSDAHIAKLLDDENIRMVIPYHKSGLNKAVAIHNNIDQFTDYTNEQNTRRADGTKLSKAQAKAHFNFNAEFRKSGNARAAADAYLKWCDKKGYIPKFDQFRNHPNYYKLLEDFTTCITENGVDTFVPQRPVQMNFPTEQSAFGSLSSLIEKGLDEDAVLEGQRSSQLNNIVDAIENELGNNIVEAVEDADLSSFRKMKTSRGEVYGFTYNGKIYLDPTTLNLEAPVHEYTELWCSVIEKQNPELWAKGVELLKQTNTWEIVNSDPNYRNLSEELRASETLSRIVAAEAAKKISEVSDSKTLIAKLRAWIRKFWNELKATFSQWTKEDISKLTLREFKAMPFRDLIEGIDPRKYQVEVGNALAASVDAAEVEAIKAERKEIEERAKADGTWLKAPNGKDTNLTPEQWVTVRTRRFKEWFGDWEKAARIEKLRRSSSIYFNGEEYKGKYVLTKESAKKYIKEQLNGEYTNADTNDKIRVSNKGANKVTSHGYNNPFHLATVAYIPTLIENSIFITELPNTKGKNEFESYRYYLAGVNIAGEEYTAKIVVGVRNGKTYYDHDLSSIEKGKLIDSIGSVPTELAKDQLTSLGVKDTRYIEILQINSSKIVDENSEPKVVYHRTPNKFTSFDVAKIGSTSDFGAFGNGFYFSPYKEQYNLYGKYLMPVFLNARVPFNLNEDNVYDIKMSFGMSSEGQRGWTRQVSKEFTQWLKDNGYDAVVYRTNYNEEEDVVFYPNQIKSVDNAGYFDPNNDDIRFAQLSAIDAEYMDAVRSGDMERATALVREYAEQRGYNTSENFRDGHRAPAATVEKKDFTNAELINSQSLEDSTDVNLYSIPQGENLAPNDFWSPQGPRWYMYNETAGLQAYAAISSAIRNINYQLKEYGEVRNIPTVKVYRAVPLSIEAGVLQNGDWVTPSKLYADRHGMARFGIDEYRIIEQEVPATELWWDGNDAREWGYDNGNVEATANTTNNVKLLDPITYDDEGNIIPLSARFDKTNSDARFMFVGENGAAGMGVAKSTTEPTETPAPKKETTSAEEKLQKQINSLREDLSSKKKNLKDTLLRVYEFLVSPEMAKAAEAGLSKVQYRMVVKNVKTAIEQAYGKKDMSVAIQVVDKYLSNIQDVMSQVVSRTLLKDITNILNTSVEGYTAQGVRYGKRIDEHTREVFKTLRSELAVEFKEEFVEDKDGKLKRAPVKYRLKALSSDGLDVEASFRLKTNGKLEKLKTEADDAVALIADVDVPKSEDTMDAMQKMYVYSLLHRYDNALEVNEQIGKVTDEINDLDNQIKEKSAAHREAVTGTAEKEALWNDLKALKASREAAIQNRAGLRKRYSLLLSSFVKTLDNLLEKGVNDLKLEQELQVQKEFEQRRGIYRSIKDPSTKILPMADVDAEGKDKKALKAKKISRGLTSENQFMRTFDSMSKDIDVNSIPGEWLESGWYYQFMLAEDGYMYRSAWRHDTEKSLTAQLTEKVKQIFGKASFAEKFAAQSTDPMNIIAYEATKPSGLKIPYMAVRTKDGRIIGGEQKNVELTIANLLYIRNTVRQKGGKAGYMAWSISEPMLDKIVEYVEANYPEYCEFADWSVNTFLPQLYEMQDAIYFKRYGTHLSKTEYYFPFARDKRFVGQIAEVGEGEVTMPSTTVGNIVERVQTAARMDLSADMFAVMRKHIKETLDWCAYSELTHKFNQFSTSKAFRNILIEQGFDPTKLKEAFEIAIGQGKINESDNSNLTKAINTISKNIVAGNLVFNFNAAIKQTISMTSVLGYSASPKFWGIWAKCYFTPSIAKWGVAKIANKIKDGSLNPEEVLDVKAFFDNWRWALKNVPTMQARWDGGNAGYEVFKAEGFARWDKVTSWIAKAGLAANTFIDMITCANGSRAVYEYQYALNIEKGMDEEKAKKDALVKAAVLINETQQSSLDAFLSPFQSGGGFARITGASLGAYQNSAMAFARNEFYNFEQIFRMMYNSNKERMIRYKAEEYRDNNGMDINDATRLATKEYKRAHWTQVNSLLHNSIISNFGWALGYSLSGVVSAFIAAPGDDELKKFFNNEEVRKQFFNTFAWTTLLYQAPLAYNHPISRQLLDFTAKKLRGENFGGAFESPLVSEVEDLITAISKQWVGVLDEATGERKYQVPTSKEKSVEYIVWSFLLKSGTGLNTRIIRNLSEGIVGMVEDGVNIEDVMNIFSSPRSLTRAIAGEPRKGESQKDYLDRVSFTYNLINAGSGDYENKWKKARIDEYVTNKERPLYKDMGIDPVEVKALEAHKKAITKSLLLQRSGKKARVKDGKVEEYKALSPKAQEQQKEMFVLTIRIKTLEDKLEGMIEFDAERSEILKQKYELEQELYNKWKKYLK